MSPSFGETTVEEATLDWLGELQYDPLHGPDIAPEENAVAIREEVAFFQCIRGQLAKMTPTEGKTPDQLDTVIRQIISRAVASDEVIDIFAAAGLNKPYIAILSDEFLAEVQRLPQKSLALEVLKKLLSDDIRTRSKKKLIQSRSFAGMLEAKENVRAKLRTMVKKILRKYGYPPDKQGKATQTVLQQAEMLCKDWAQ
jgi:type I site-specific restriction-modification system R (restriction) subunit